MDYYRADLNELNTPNGPSVEELEIEPFVRVSLSSCLGQPIRSPDTFTRRFCTLRRGKIHPNRSSPASLITRLYHSLLF
ncbi:hypothetical protein BDM02DRAFT_2001309 [Thelephora ganbajun]|uniref:Uncharacterized protein n=1 Tax=Thelephora ganbajun TaxID=370292 RepID=A0ACB6ZHD5_THEGA|nr:hypothetical protein BDM02DRAFT_2001309 [Thelephora ganbajun]